MRIAWLTDIHLDHVSEYDARTFFRMARSMDPLALISRRKISDFFQTLVSKKVDAVLVTGDIGAAPMMAALLKWMEEDLPVPTYFVLGNHDFYGGSITQVRKMVEEICARSRTLCWLPNKGVIHLASGVALIGHDGWADGRYGNFMASTIRLNDYSHIKELKESGNKKSLLKALHVLGDESGHYIADQLPEALRNFEHIIVATHPPPFREAAWHDGRPSDDDWAPHFSCKAMGDVLLHAAEEYPGKRITVLCGHTHGEGVATIRDNLHVFTGKAEYGLLQIYAILDITQQGLGLPNPPRWTTPK